MGVRNSCCACLRTASRHTPASAARLRTDDPLHGAGTNTKFPSDSQHALAGGPSGLHGLDDDGANPVDHGLAKGRASEGVVRGSENGYEDLGVADFPGGRVHDRHRLAGVIDKEAFAGRVNLPQRIDEFAGRSL